MSNLDWAIRLLRRWDRRKIRNARQETNGGKQIAKKIESAKNKKIGGKIASILNFKNKQNTNISISNINPFLYMEVNMHKKIGEKVTYILNFMGSGIKAINVEISYPTSILHFDKSTNNPVMFDLVPVSLINGAEGNLQVSAARTDAGVVSSVNGDWICRLEFDCLAKSNGPVPVIFTKKTMLNINNQSIPNVFSLDNNEVEVIEEVRYGVWLTVE